MTNEKAFWAGVALVAVLVLALLGGRLIGRQNVADDCAAIGAFSHLDKVYDCKERTK